MNTQKLTFSIINEDPDSEYKLYESCVNGFYHLGTMGEKGLHLIDATVEEILTFVRENK